MSAKKSSISNIVTKVFVYLLSFAVSMITARILGPNDKGILGFALVIISFCTTLLTFGLGMGMYYQMSSRKYKSEDVIFTVIILSFLIAMMIDVCIIALYKFGLAPFLNLLSIHHIYILCVLVFAGVVGNFLTRVFLANDLFIKDNKIKVVVGLSQPIFLILLVVVFSLGLDGAFLAMILMYLLSVCMQFYFIRKLFLINRIFIHKSFLIDSWNYGIKSWASDVAHMANLRMDQIMLSFYVTPFQLGIYTVAVTLSELLWIIPDGINSVLLNKMTSTEINTSSKIQLVARICKANLFVASMISVLLLLGTYFILIPYGYGSDYLSSIQPLLLLLPGGIIIIVAKAITKIFSGMGHVEDTTTTMLIGSCFAMLFYLLLIPKFGINGAAIGSSLGYLCVSIVSLWLLRRKYPEDFNFFSSWSNTDYIWMRSQCEQIWNSFRKSSKGFFVS